MWLSAHFADFSVFGRPKLIWALVSIASVSTNATDRTHSKPHRPANKRPRLSSRPPPGSPLRAASDSAAMVDQLIRDPQLIELVLFGGDVRSTPLCFVVCLVRSLLLCILCASHSAVFVVVGVVVVHSYANGDQTPSPYNLWDQWGDIVTRHVNLFSCR